MISIIIIIITIIQIQCLKSVIYNRVNIAMVDTANREGRWVIWVDKDGR